LNIEQIMSCDAPPWTVLRASRRISPKHGILIDIMYDHIAKKTALSKGVTI